ncbi:MAG: hypothetical protein ACRD2R_00465 [Terriglobales bacterium]
MDHTIRLSAETMSRLKRCAEPYVDKEPEDTIRRLLEHFEAGASPDLHSLGNDRRQHTTKPITRAPRERGVVAELADQRIQASSVSDFYTQALKHLVDRHSSRLDAFVPFATSGQRYLVAKSPKHPTGNKFVVPVNYKGYYMEAHKDYRNAVNHLEQLAAKMGLSFRYLA